jgi:uncharacterized SAM-binding protein YcdF (DUF218 family)
MSRVRVLLLALGIAVGFFAVTAYLTRNTWLRAMGDMLVRHDEPFQADAISVLGGDWFGDRVLKAGELIRGGYAPVALVSGNGYLYGKFESELAIQFAVAHGYDAKYFREVKYPCNSTREEAQAVVRELRTMHVKRLLLVTSAFHTARAGRIFAAEAPEFELRVIPSQDTLLWQQWWTTRESRKTFLMEWTKSVTARFGI